MGFAIVGTAPNNADGMIHVESNIIRNYTLGEFLSIWGIEFGDIVFFR
jgi:hypothetical protein